MTFSKAYVAEAMEILDAIDARAIEDCVAEIADVRDHRGRLFILGVGGSAATASHAVNDFRKICHIEAYAPTDNIAELTARTNDDGWETTLSRWLDISRLSNRDGLLVLSVSGGGPNGSQNLVSAMDLAVEVDASIVGIIGPSGGYAATVATSCVCIPAANPVTSTAHVEGVAMVLLHLICNHPRLIRRDCEATPLP